MAKMQLLQQFTIEVPTSDNTNDIIKGALIPESKKMLNEIKEKFSENVKKSKKLEKGNKKISRLEQKIESLTELIGLIKDETNKMNKLDERQKCYDELYILQDEREIEYDALLEFDPKEIKAKEHIQRRVRADEENKGKIFELCEKYSYAMVFDTILEDIAEGK